MRLSLTVLALAAATTALTTAGPLRVPGCRPAPGLGILTYRQHAIDLATCAEHPAGQPKAPVPVARVRSTSSGRSRRDTIWAGSRPVFSTRVVGDTSTLESSGSIELLGASSDRRWIFFAIDSGGSGSIAADGLILRVVPASGGRAHELGVMLPYPDYLSWCGDRLVFSAGSGREAVEHKRLLAAAPPAWRPRPLTGEHGRAWGSLACAGRAVVVQGQPSGQFDGFFATSWSLWRVGLDGSKTRMTRPPAGYADESPRISRDGRTVMFVRSRKGHGRLFALRDRHLLGPLLPLGYSLGYYGHRDWWATRRWSPARRP